jgi:hypothetical protein
VSKEPSKKSFEGAYYFVRSVHPDLPADVIEKVAKKIAKQMDKITAPPRRKRKPRSSLPGGADE